MDKCESRCKFCGDLLMGGDACAYNPDCLTSQLAAVTAERDRYKNAILWALGYTDFEPRKPGEPAYWWRKGLRARAEEAEKKLEWRPIETAPKDGKAVLLHNNKAPGNPSGRMESCEGYNTVVGEWWASDQSDNDADGFGDWACYMDAIEDPRCPFEPTHWMPLPAAPDQKGES